MANFGAIFLDPSENPFQIAFIISLLFSTLEAASFQVFLVAVGKVFLLFSQ